ncbi:aspartyl/asparaginyl beta-hydroxylase domain-containing protein [Xanthomonas floridensis]|uniref:Aspartyl beta-hydroxylase n=1 Tax=Xanthomonas floridensis TaxID=1843580 RepID=A0A1A9MBX5_9XANT|nr:aspartyl/asparaginyl beta-hydroxylase domain-containing protein [Xanthomonas floridensis]MEA5125339.1 aspartyl/asparaginyl beta-hydroxylase domain-containing protein [Xanthomonas floridensis]MEA5132975.1 aspartyl/asparaginyl beta-hydroxylase domain-containing protein [Xanthomonas floridensis]OAG67376.1 aspartyl beta-hydroxylase [Xanthomonas floridensis]
MAAQVEQLNARIAELMQQAGAEASAGRWQQAEQLWRQVRQLSPAHPQALYSLGVHAHQRGDALAALEFLQGARASSPADPMIVLTIAVVKQAQGDIDGEWQAISAVLIIDPYFLPGLLAKAAFLDARGRTRAAAGVYRDALKVAPPEPQWPAVLRRKLARASQAVEQDTLELEAQLRAVLHAPRASVDAALHGRWDEAAAIASGRSRPFHSQSNRLHIPRLPAVTFHDIAAFPWVAALQEQTAAITEELHAVMHGDREGFAPYIAYAAGQPVNQWQALNHSPAWSSYPLWQHGQPVQSHVQRCPVTAAALSLVDAARIDGVCPNAMFSVLAPHTVIPPHHGETNARLVAHLPLIVPEGCSFRVGFDWRRWEVGQVLVFDDSIEHEARNDSAQARVVLIFDVWNPLLSNEERAMVNAMETAIASHRAG